MNSIWNEVRINTFNELKEDGNTDVLIIGGGIAGILCAYLLHSAGVSYMLVEGSRIGRGITKNTTAKITSQHGLIYHKLLKKYGEEKARLYFNANESALSKYEELSKKYQFDFVLKDSFVFSRNDKKILEKESAALDKLKIPAEYTQTTSLPFETAGAVNFKNQAEFHPLKLISKISKGLHIYENTFVKELIKTTAITNHGKIEAKRIVVATHFPFLNKHGSYYLKMYQNRSYVIALHNAALLDGMYREETQNGLSFRNYNDLLLIGGGGHKTGKKGGNFKELREFARFYYPNADERYYWAAQDCMTLDHIPYIGKYSKSCENLYTATGFNKWGMTGSMTAAITLCDMLCGRQNEYTELFSPSRSIFKPQLLFNGINAVTNFLTPSFKRCPHLGCALKWNKVERSWDCPCHGSRFTKDGTVIDNPANGSL